MNVAQLVERHGDQGRRALALRLVTRHDAVDDLAAAGGGALEERRAMLAARAVPGRPVANAPMPAEAPQAAAPPPMAAPPAKAAAPVLVAPPAPALEAAIAQEKEARDNRAVLGKRARREAPPAQQDLVVVREYAHELRPGRQPDDRLDFTETLFWAAAARTDARTGEVTVRFALNDSVTTFKVLASGFDDRGALGAGTGAIESTQPFYLEPKLPLEVTAGDHIDLPVSLVNGTPAPLRGATLAVGAPRF